jgi:hypothetical protein
VCECGARLTLVFNARHAAPRGTRMCGAMQQRNPPIEARARSLEEETMLMVMLLVVSMKKEVGRGGVWASHSTLSAFLRTHERCLQNVHSSHKSEKALAMRCATLWPHDQQTARAVQLNSPLIIIRGMVARLPRRRQERCGGGLWPPLGVSPPLKSSAFLAERGPLKRGSLTFFQILRLPIPVSLTNKKPKKFGHHDILVTAWYYLVWLLVGGRSGHLVERPAKMCFMCTGSIAGDEIQGGWK